MNRNHTAYFTTAPSQHRPAKFKKYVPASGQFSEHCYRVDAGTKVIIHGVEFTLERAVIVSSPKKLNTENLMAFLTLAKCDGWQP